MSDAKLPTQGNERPCLLNLRASPMLRNRSGEGRLKCMSVMRSQTIQLFQEVCDLVLGFWRMECKLVLEGL